MNVSERLPRESNREYAFRVIRDNIISLGLEPGSTVGEQELANMLGLSRTPVHEALLDLSKTRIVEIYPQRGSKISLIDYDLLTESNFIRRVMEVAVVELACSMVTADDIVKLEENVKLQEFYLENPLPERILKLDDEFHRSLYVICCKEQCYNMVTSMSIHLDRVRNMTLHSVKSTKIVSDHRAILEAIKARDSKTAVAVLNKHLSRYVIDVNVVMQQCPQYFAEGPWKKLNLSNG